MDHRPWRVPVELSGIFGLIPPFLSFAVLFFHKGQGEGLRCGKILHTQSVLRIVITQA